MLNAQRGETMLILEKFEKKDMPEFLDWLKDSDAEFLIRFAGPGYRFPLDEEQLLDTLHDKSSLVFKATEQAAGKMIGHCQLMSINFDDKTASVGRVLIKPEERGFGYGYAMLKQLMDYADNNLKLKQLNLRVYDFNESAYQCYLKLGFAESKREKIVLQEINKTWNRITMDYSI